MAKGTVATSINEYIAPFPPATRRVLKELRALVRANAPGATEKISYAIPAFNLNGRNLLYFAGWKEHVSLYPVTAGLAKALREEIKPYRTGKGTLQFPLDQPLPTDLICRIVAFRVAEVTARR